MKTLPNTIQRLLLVLVSPLLFAAPAGAVLVSFDFDGSDNNLSTITKTVSGLTLTLSNPSPDTTFPADFDGLGVFSDGGFGDLKSFDMTFSAPVNLVSYTASFVDALEGDESITFATAVNSSVENGFLNGGADIIRNFTNQFSVTAGEVIDVTGNIGGLGTDLIQWNRLTVNTIPEPNSVLFIGLASLAITFRRKRS